MFTRIFVILSRKFFHKRVILYLSNRDRGGKRYVSDRYSESLFRFFKTPDINQGVQEYKAIPGAVLLDVRMPQEYREGHIPKSKNVPLQSIEKALSVVKSKNSPVFVYCHSGARSRQAVGALQKMGYENVKI